MPPMPPMPPPPCRHPRREFSPSPALSVTTASVVRSRPEIDAAFCSALRVTLVGSTTPAFTRSTYLAGGDVVTHVALALLDLLHDERSLPGPRCPRAGVQRGLEGTCGPSAAPTASSPSKTLELVDAPSGRGSMPRSAAGDDALFDGRTSRVQTRLRRGAFFSFISVSVAAPTLTTATPPASLARRSWSFSRS